MTRDDEVGAGPLARAAAVVYRVMVVEAMLALTTLPSVVAYVLLTPDASNLPLYALALLPVGPAVAAALFTFHAEDASGDLSPSRPFWRGWRLNLRPVLAWWAPFLAVVGVLGVNLAHLDTVPGGAALRPVLVVVAAAVFLWSGHMLLLTAIFTFRLGDAARLALWAIAAHWRVTLGIVGCGVIAAALVQLGTEALLVLFAAPLTLLLYWAARPLLTDVTGRFTRHD